MKTITNDKIGKLQDDQMTRNKEGLLTIDSPEYC